MPRNLASTYSYLFIVDGPAGIDIQIHHYLLSMLLAHEYCIGE